VITLAVGRRNLLVGIGSLLILGAIFYCGWQYVTSVQATLSSGDKVSEAVEDKSELLIQKVKEVKPEEGDTSAPASAGITAGKNADVLTPVDSIPAAAVGVRAKGSASEFFAEFRMERDRVRGQQVELYREIVNNSGSTDSIRIEAQQRLFTLTQDMEKEMKSENLLVARGYSEAVVFLQPQGVTAVVFCPKFSEEQQRSVVSLVSRILGCQEEKVSVIARG